MDAKKIMLGCVSILLCLSIFACSKEEQTPEEAFHDFAGYLQQGNYEEMYELLTDSAKEAISAKAFIERYEKIYQGIEAKELTINVEQIDEETKRSKNEPYPLSFTQRMLTRAGEVTTAAVAELVFHDETKTWKIDWTPGLIFPELAEGDKVRVETLPAKRGELFDRNRSGLAVNGVMYEIGLVPERIESEQETVEQLAHVLGLSQQQIKEALQQEWIKPDMFVPLLSIPVEQQETVAQIHDIAGATYREVGARVYPFKQATAHLTGYIGPISAEELEKLNSEGYQAHDQIGKAGLEKIVEPKLRGEDGSVIYIVDQQGNQKAEIARKEAVDGEDIQLTIDAGQQQMIYEQFSNEPGTAVSLNPNTGEVLSLVSSPAYDPNEFIRGLTAEAWQRLNENEAKPLLNRFTQRYAPGSIMKPVTAAIGLAHNWDSEEEKQISGKQWQKDSSWGNYAITRVNEVNRVDLTAALVHSDNIYFAQMALELGADAFLSGLNSFGFHEEIPFPYGMAMSTVANNGISSDIQLADTAYGQGELLVTPLHLALLYAPFITGEMPKPLLYKDERPSVWKADVIETEDAGKIVADLTAVAAEGVGGAGTLAGKTGTTEYKQTQGEAGKENGGFIAFHADNPEQLVLMMIENVEHRGGSSYVVPKVRAILEQLAQE
ncbi:penicillin-binding transpeptidase domain-containing protein [Alkalihalobacillus oceani]|uniref:penicillin-binding transpeptidase domain-containing protein n=1 Tax=Halalkalibacter oceani TaxID=1653776 RepID=UPI002040A9E5|nr:penicillin-binding transpeptidase domain-containing protein [Halalkalibacter oceani]MCM3761632.1 penicillin-binding transpeptidase domain-containing protein [Halalkalibacter oceani]